ncbi:MAG TPA: HEAT repeat domain-containing protein [Chloroflexia bacterium]|nr:HEAT repeat domain-containing protein [Chloroflexia bacterium]
MSKPFSVPDLIETLLTSENSAARCAAANALHDIKEVVAVEPLIKALQDGDRWVRYSAVRALGSIRDRRAFQPVADLLQVEADPTVCEIAAANLAALDLERSFPLLIDIIENGSPPAKAAAARTIRDIDTGKAETVGPLTRLLANKHDWEARLDAIYALGETGTDDPQAIELLLLAMAEDDAAICSAAIFALGELGVERAIKPVAHLLLNSPSASLRRDAATALGDFEDEQVIEPLLVALGDHDEYVRAYASGSLAGFATPRVIQALIQLVGQDKSEVVGIYAVQALRELKAVEASELLIEILLKSPSNEVRKLVPSALAATGNPVAVPPLMKALQSNEVLEVRVEALHALARLAPFKAEKLLIEALRDGAAEMRLAAVVELGNIAGEEALPALLLLAGNDHGQSPWREKLEEAISGAIKKIKERSQAGRK